MVTRRQCTATANSTAKRCTRRPIKGGLVCIMHGGSAPQVKRAAAQRIADMLGEALDPDRVLRETGRIAFSDIREVFDEDGHLLPAKKWPDNIARAVKSIDTVRGNLDKGDGQFDAVVKIQLWDKPGKLQDLMKHHGQLDTALNVNITVIDSRLKAARLRMMGDGEQR